jgi:hypothetical protein
MDGLSIAASAFAVVSLAIQLADSVIKISHVCKSYKHAPEQVDQIVGDLDLLRSIFGSIAQASVVVNSSTRINANSVGPQTSASQPDSRFSAPIHRTGKMSATD